MHQILFTILILLGVSAVNVTFAQSKSRRTENSSLCSANTSLDTVRQQIEITKTLDSTPQRISILIRAADLLWAPEENRARAAFTEALELAHQNFKQRSEKPVQEGRLLVEARDYRYTVLGSIAKRDPAWAKKLTNQMLQEETKEVESASAVDHQRTADTAQKLLSAASSLVSTDLTSALNFATASLKYPPTLSLTIFLYRLAELNPQAADAFYAQALTAYANESMNGFLYLSAYPFGAARDAGEMPAYTVYRVPATFVPNRTMQRQFTGILLSRARSVLEAPPAAAPTEGRGRDPVSDSGQIWLALTRLQDQIRQSLPDLDSQVEQAKRGMYSLLSQDSQRRVDQLFKDRNQPARSFGDQLEAAEKQSDPDRRDQMLAFAVLGSASEDLERVIKTVEMISDTEVRSKLLAWLYFSRAQAAIKDKRLDDARKLAAKVPELDRRAYLYSNLAEESLKQNSDQAHAREILEEVANTLASAPRTVVTARALLGVAYLYTRIDVHRSTALLSDAVKTINRIENPDFSNQYVQIRVEGKNFGFYTGFQTPGFNPENAFREFAKVNYDDAFYQASNFADKSMRALTTLAVAETCLQQTPVSQHTYEVPEQIDKKSSLPDLSARKNRRGRSTPNQSAIWCLRV